MAVSAAASALRQELTRLDVLPYVGDLPFKGEEARAFRKHFNGRDVTSQAMQVAFMVRHLPDATEIAGRPLGEQRGEILATLSKLFREALQEQLDSEPKATAGARMREGQRVTEDVAAQEVPAQRFFVDMARMVMSSVGNVMQELAFNYTIEALVEAPKDRDGDLDVVQLAATPLLKAKVHFHAVVLMLEAVWRTTIEAIAWTIHKMAPGIFGEEYTIEQREQMLTVQIASLKMLSVFAFMGIGSLVENPDEIEEVLDQEDTGVLERYKVAEGAPGTPYDPIAGIQGDISWFTSDTYQGMPPVKA